MKRYLFILLTSLTATLQAQTECQMSYVSHHYVLNKTNEVITIWVNNKDQENYPRKGPDKFEIEPGVSVKITELGWAEEFRDPTGWYVFKVESKGLTPLCDKKNWKFERLNETEGMYSLILEPTIEEACEELDELLYFTDPVPEKVEEEIYDFAEVAAEFPGGSEGLYMWINKNIQYPQQALQDSISGRVFVEFVVEKTGELSLVKVLRSPHELLSQESIRLINAMPNWEPARLRNQIVRTRYRLPINFSLG